MIKEEYRKDICDLFFKKHKEKNNSIKTEILKNNKVIEKKDVNKKDEKTKNEIKVKKIKNEKKERNEINKRKKSMKKMKKNLKIENIEELADNYNCNNSCLTIKNRIMRLENPYQKVFGQLFNNEDREKRYEKRNEKKRKVFIFN